MTHVALRGLTGIYPGAAAPALDRLTLDVPRGSLTALIGPSGCGKTTAMKLIAGLLPPASGDIAFDGRSILHDPPETRGVVMVFQNHLLFPHMSVADNVGFGLRMRHLPQPRIASRVAEMLALVQLHGMGARRPAELSGGQQQRVALARALIVQPRVLLLDEPLSNLDAHLRLEMRDLIRSLQRSLQITTIFVTHDQEEAVVMADRIALILDGRLRQDDPPAQFYNRPRDRAVAQFFGGRNFIPGTVAGTRFDGAAGPLIVAPGLPQGPGLLTIRPEAVRLGDGPNPLTLRIEERVYLGTQTRLKLQGPHLTLEALVPPDLAEGLSPGATIPIHLPPAALWLMTPPP